MEPTRAQLLREARLALAAGRAEAALAGIERALGLTPDEPTLLLEHASLLRAVGQPGRARESAHRATRLAPVSSPAHAELGLAFLDLRKFSNAESSFKKALEFNRANPEALAGYGRLRLAQKRFAEAEAMLVSALRARPTDARLFVLLGDVLAARGNKAGTIEAYRRAREIDVLNTEALDKYVAAKAEVGGIDAARAALEEAAARTPDVPQVHLVLGKFLSGHGMLEPALASVRTALSLDPASVGAAFLLSESKRFTASDDPDIALVAEAYRRSEPDTRNRATAAFALAKASDDVKRYEPAFDAYLEGNTILRREMEFSLQKEAQAFDSIASSFSAGRMAQLRGGGHPSAAPIFILGMPRSGTTLTETILSRHPDVYAAGELEVMRVAATGVVGASPVSEAKLFIDRLKSRQLATIGASYLSQVEAQARRSPRFTDKMPHNFTKLGLIRLVFPNARIVHVRRDPLDNCLSMFKANFAAEALAFSFDLVELGRYYNLYRKLMQHWRDVLPGEFHEIGYEALVTDPETATRALFDYCGLEWSADVLAIGDNRREVRTMSFAQVRQPINTASVSAAARYGSRLDPLRAALAEWDAHQP